MAQLQVCCHTGIIRSSASVRALSSLSIVCTRSLTTEPTHNSLSIIVFARFFPASVQMSSLGAISSPPLSHEPDVPYRYTNSVKYIRRSLSENSEFHKDCFTKQFRKCAAVLFWQGAKSCTDLDRNLLYRSILRTCMKFAGYNDFLALTLFCLDTSKRCPHTVTHN